MLVARGRWFRSFPALGECLRIHGAKKLQNDKSTKWDVQVSKLVRFKDGRMASSGAKPLYRGVDGHKQRQNPEDPKLKCFSWLSVDSIRHFFLRCKASATIIRKGVLSHSCIEDSVRVVRDNA